MNICIVYQDNYPWDVRIEKFCKTFANNGHNVYLVAKNSENDQNFEKISKNFEIHRLKFFKNRYLNLLFNFPAFFSFTWITKVYNVAKNNKCKLIIVRDLPLTLSAVFVGRLLKIPVFMDMAENYPEMIRDTWKYGKISKIDYLIRNPFILKKMELFSLLYVTKLYVVSEESKERLLALNVSGNKIYVIGNTPCIDNISFNDSIYNEIRTISDFNILYVGGLEESRGLEIVIKSMPEIKKYIENFAFIIVGKGNSYEYLKKLALDLNVSKNVFFIGWKPHVSIYSIIKGSDIGIIPHYVTNHTNTTLPNKLYDYMLQGKPVLVSNSKSLSNIVLKENCGYVFRDKDVSSFSEKILSLIKSEDRAFLGENGRNAVKQLYNWDEDSKVLLDSLKDI